MPRLKTVRSAPPKFIPPGHPRVWLAGIAALSLGFGVWAGSLRPVSGQPGPAAEAKPGRFRPSPDQLAGLRIEPVRLATFRPEYTTEGNIATDEDRTTPVFSPYTGRVMRLFAGLGERVERGAPLFSVEATEFVQAQNDLIAAVAGLRTARGQLTQAQVNEKRAHELYLANGGALKDWQQSQTDLNAAQNAVRTAEIALTAVRNRLRILGKTEAEIAALEAQPTQRLAPVTVVAAPIAGMVTQRQIGLGQFITSASNGGGSPVYTIGDLTTVWLIANVRESEAALVRIGMQVEVRVPAYPERVFDARVSWIAPSLDASTRRLAVRAEVANPDLALRPLMFGKFTLVTGPAHTAPAVPKSALIYEGDTARVWVAAVDGSIAPRDVTTGQSSNDLVEIRAGLAEGDKIVTRGALFIDRAGGIG